MAEVVTLPALQQYMHPIEITPRMRTPLIGKQCPLCDHHVVGRSNSAVNVGLTEHLNYCHATVRA